MQDKNTTSVYNENIVQEIMGLVESAIESAELAEYESHSGREFDSDSHKQDCKEIVFEIQSKLRELVERKPLSEERVWEIEADSYVVSRRPEYTKDCFGDEKTIWHETKNFSFPLFARNIEAAHNITNTSN